MVHILLSTYNGEKYVLEQLKSIFSQKFQQFKLYIRDDGSSDQTVKKIKEYLKKYPMYAQKTRWIKNAERKNLGYMQSFWKLLEEADGADYYAFCDQDDVWLPEKIARGVEALEREKKDVPLLYFSNFYQCNEDLSMKKKSMIYHEDIKFENVLFYTPAFGFSIILNEELRKLVLGDFDHAELPHDGWIQKTAAAFGKIIYDPVCTAYYRRHETAVTAQNANKITLIKNWVQNEILGESLNKNHAVLKKFYQVYGSKLKEEDRRLLQTYVDSKQGFMIWWKRVCFKEKMRPSFGGRMALRICFILGRY